jgi:hypothetical protein
MIDQLSLKYSDVLGVFTIKTHTATQAIKCVKIILKASHVYYLILSDSLYDHQQLSRLSLFSSVM